MSSARLHVNEPLTENKSSEALVSRLQKENSLLRNANRNLVKTARAMGRELAALQMEVAR